MSARLLVLLQSNYLVLYVGHGSVGHREALVVEARRPAGGLAARFWVDAVTKLPLRREIFDAGRHMISDDAFTGLELGDPGPGGRPAAAAPWPAQLDRARLAALRAEGWQLPDQLPGNLSLFAATQTSARLGPVVDLSYSDGLAVVSLFVQRGALGRPMMPGWRPVTLSGQTVYAVGPEDRSFAWSAGGFVYTLVADAPMQTVSQVVAALPGTTRLGFWPRIARGLRRLASWINPVR
jgi:sigma-E factor negative regulatory protein RseB